MGEVDTKVPDAMFMAKLERERRSVVYVGAEPPVYGKAEAPSVEVPDKAKTRLSMGPLTGAGVQPKVGEMRVAPGGHAAHAAEVAAGGYE